jgi:hypothetical protein
MNGRKVLDPVKLFLLFQIKVFKKYFDAFIGEEFNKKAAKVTKIAKLNFL